MRSYSTEPQIWGGDPSCSHQLEDTPGLPPMTGGSGPASAKQVTNAGSQFGNAWAETERVAQRAGNGGERSTLGIYADGRSFYADGFDPAKQAKQRAMDGPQVIRSATCTRCGAWRGELGSEPTHDCNGAFTGVKCGACFICHLVEVFTAVKRVLRPDGVVLCNLGDSYAGSGKGPTGHNGIGDQERRQGFSTSKGARIGSVNGESGHTSGVKPPPGLKAKDLCMIPARFALAMQAHGWWLRSEITWCKTSAMPESVTDRPTNATEKIFLFAKSDRYFWDSEAVRQPNTLATIDRMNGPARRYAEHKPLGTIPPGHPTEAQPEYHHNGLTVNGGGSNGANLRNYWVLGPEPFNQAHFAVFPSEIPRRAIRAGTSERGACAACGAPHKRITERVGGDTETTGRPKAAGQNGYGSPTSTLSLSGNGSKEWAERGSKRVEQGWAPTCSHLDADVVPCKVLDIFNGSGTSMVVARQLGRYGVGIELSEQYCLMAMKRLRQAVLL